jgi:hypothetical protein
MKVLARLSGSTEAQGTRVGLNQQIIVQLRVQMGMLVGPEGQSFSAHKGI